MPDGAILLDSKHDKDENIAAAAQLLALLKALMLLAPLVGVIGVFFMLKQDVSNALREAAEAKEHAAEARATAAQATALAVTARSDATGADGRAMAAITALSVETAKSINALATKTSEGLGSLTVQVSRLEVAVDGLREDIAEQKAKVSGK